eukprot:gnl/MRDRNA2_/MRDRNA2_94481_c0_seq1.p1 gnl/MRDRNA2_/MRDRNA2_94481_c0~~gnl/MRDRNA2_/MRDRNA2_94481_c0_seq1.p1  ORF type:complete len:186 (+),score=24.91 gnl/MRDRNA2_/MRDRNA2_94481_c0_seq1:79-636(+)
MKCSVALGVVILAVVVATILKSSQSSNIFSTKCDVLLQTKSKRDKVRDFQRLNSAADETTTSIAEQNEHVEHRHFPNVNVMRTGEKVLPRVGELYKILSILGETHSQSNATPMTPAAVIQAYLSARSGEKYCNLDMTQWEDWGPCERNRDIHRLFRRRYRDKLSTEAKLLENCTTEDIQVCEQQK